jgi:hypothetical protein
MVENEDLSQRVLRLEKQIESYQELHADEIDEIRRLLERLRSQVFRLQTSSPRGNTNSENGLKHSDKG